MDECKGGARYIVAKCSTPVHDSLCVPNRAVSASHAFHNLAAPALDIAWWVITEP